MAGVGVIASHAASGGQHALVTDPVHVPAQHLPTTGEPAYPLGRRRQRQSGLNGPGFQYLTVVVLLLAGGGCGLVSEFVISRITTAAQRLKLPLMAAGAADAATRAEQSLSGYPGFLDQLLQE